MSIAMGIVLAIVTTYSKVINVLVSPLLSIIKATPVASFIILACVWLDRNILPVVITSLIVIPIVWSNISEGFSYFLIFIHILHQKTSENPENNGITPSP